MKKNLIKYDKNFSEYPLWFQDKRAKAQFVWEDIDGYKYESPYKAPIRTDYLFLLFFLLESQKEGWNDEISCVRAEVLRRCGLLRSKVNYDRLSESLKRWKRVTISFSGTFYNNKKYESIEFGIIDTWKIETTTKKRQTGRLIVRFNPEWLLHQKHSKFFQMLDFDELKNLKDPFSLRFYELLVKQFHARKIWKIDAKKLAAKIPIQEKYPSHIILKVESAIKRISKHTDLKIKLETERQRGKALLTFIKITNEDKSVANEDSILNGILNAIPEKDQHSCKTICIKILKERSDGNACLIWIINYVKEKGYKNFGAYVRFAYEKKLYDLHLEQKRLEDEFISEQESVNKTKNEELVKRDKALQESQDKEETLNVMINSLSPEDTKELNNRIIKMLEVDTSKGGKFRYGRYLKYIHSDEKRALQSLHPYRKSLIEDFLAEKKKKIIR